MIYFQLFIVFCYVLFVLVAFFNWLSRPYMKRRKSLDHPLVSVLIPARNEERNLPLLLNDLKDCNYPNIEVIVCDDDSSDQTPVVLEEFAKECSNLTIIKNDQLPGGWVGKNHACYLLSKKATGSYFLFIDADVRLSKDAISKAVAFMQKSSVQLLSLFPAQIIKTPGEWKVVPLMNVILLTLLPLRFVQWFSLAPFSAANGQFMMFKTQNYIQNNWHARFKSSYVEDIAIARTMKKERQRIATLLGSSDVKCRMYPNMEEGINGFSKNIQQIFGGSDVFMVAYLLIFSLGIPIMLFLNLRFFAILVLLFVFIQLFVAMISCMSIKKQGIYCILQLISFYRIAIKSFQNRRKGSISWKGREIIP